MVLDRSHLKALSSLKTTVRARFISIWGRGWHLNFWAGLTHQYPSTRYDNLRCLEGVTIIAKFSLTKVHHAIIKESTCDNNDF